MTALDRGRVVVELATEERDRLARDIAAQLVAELHRLHDAEQRSPWLNAAQAAEYIAAPVSRVRKLTSLGLLRSYRDGGRVLYRRSELDEFVRSGGSTA